jgi:hypothetical protein
MMQNKAANNIIKQHNPLWHSEQKFLHLSGRYWNVSFGKDRTAAGDVPVSSILWGPSKVEISFFCLASHGGNQNIPCFSVSVLN